MGFILIAPGVRDVLPYPEVFAHRPVEQTQVVARTRKTADGEKERAGSTVEQSLQKQHAQHSYEQLTGLVHERAQAFVAEQIMSAPVLTLEPDTLVTQAWALFHQHRFRHVLW